MSKISQERLERYRQLANRDLWDIDHDGFNRFFNRARQEGVQCHNSLKVSKPFVACDGLDIVAVGMGNLPQGKFAARSGSR